MKIVVADKKGISEAVRVILSDGVVVYPTDTVYGMGCNPFSKKGLEKLLSIKSQRKKALPLLVSSKNKVKEIAILNRLSKKLMANWPGPLTLILKSKITFPSQITMGSENIAIRIPNHTVTLQIIDKVGGILVGTSANFTGEPPSLSINEVKNTIGTKVDLIVDGGPSSLKEPSTIVDASDGTLQIIREGALKLTKKTVS